MKKTFLFIILLAFFANTKTTLFAQDDAEEKISEFMGGDTNSPLSYIFDFTNLKMKDNYEYIFKKLFISVLNSTDKSWGYYDMKASKGEKVKIDGKDYFIINAEVLPPTGKEMKHPDFRKKIRFGFPDYEVEIYDEILILDDNNKTLFLAVFTSED